MITGRRQQAMGAVVLAGLAAAAGALQDNRYPVHRLALPVTLDGRLEERAWQAVPEATGFVLRYEGPKRVEFSPLQVGFRMGAADKTLYVGIRAEEPQIDACLDWAREKIEESGTFAWNYQMMELRVGTYCFDADILGHTRCHRYGSHPPEILDFPWSCKVVHGPDAYTVEMAIEWRGFDREPKPGESLSFHLRRTGTCWPRAECLKGIHWRTANETAYDGTLEFKETALEPGSEAVRHIEEQVNREFIEWRDGPGKAVLEARRTLKRLADQPNLARPATKEEAPRGTVFGKPRGMPPEEPPNWTWLWHFNPILSPHPETATLEWPEPITFNALRIQWGTDQYATHYALEYRDGETWKTAFVETDHRTALSCHLFPPVTSPTIRLTVLEERGGSPIVIKDIGLYRVEEGNGSLSGELDAQRASEAERAP